MPLYEYGTLFVLLPSTTEKVVLVTVIGMWRRITKETVDGDQISSL